MYYVFLFLIPQYININKNNYQLMISYLKSFFQNLNNIIYKKRHIFIPLTKWAIKSILLL